MICVIVWKCIKRISEWFFPRHIPINLSGFEARETKLKAILRYLDSHTHAMLYRTNNWMHSWRVLGHLEKKYH